MRNKRVLVWVAILGLLLGLAGVSATASAAPTQHRAEPAITGVWHTTVKIEALPEAFYGLWSFYGDGNFLDINSDKETNPGIWMGASDTYVLTFWAFSYDDEGKVNGKGRIRLAIKLDGADHFKAKGVTDVFDLQGKPMESPFNGPFTVEGDRMQMELP
jgi:hypothetical protein